MTSEWDRARAILQSALERDIRARRRYVEAACAGDTELERDVLSLLSALENDPGFLERPAFRSDLPDRIGSYRVLRRVGEGGMGVVYEAVREGSVSSSALQSRP